MNSVYPAAVWQVPWITFGNSQATQLMGATFKALQLCVHDWYTNGIPWIGSRLKRNARYLRFSFFLISQWKIKSKAVPLHTMEAFWGKICITYSFMTLALDGEWSASRPSHALRPGKGPLVPIRQKAGWAPEPVWTQMLEEKSFCLCRGVEPRSPGHLARNQTLYWLSYSAHHNEK
jgi:hypothetical protein